jgi:hypothetical protein
MESPRLQMLLRIGKGASGRSHTFEIMVGAA